jgi:hypothetical protein
MVHLQEEFDWVVYALFDLLPPCPHAVPPGEFAVPREARPFLWPDNTVPETVPEALRPLYAWRRARIEDTKSIRLLETKVHKRLWKGVRGVFGHGNRSWEEQVQDACGEWLLDRLETALQSGDPAPVSLARLARDLARDPKVTAVAEVLTGTTDPELAPLLARLAEQESVPYLAAQRFKPSGLKKYRLWQKTWAAQRAEDAWEAGGKQGPRPTVPLPPKYGSGDFLQQHWWRLRGKLDVPKERFIAYPGAEEGTSPVIGWAGWDHADRMAALGMLLEQAEGEPDKQLPLLAGMAELLPWVRQWHEDDDRYGTPLGPMWAEHIEGERVRLGLSRDQLQSWAPPKKARSNKTRSQKSGSGGRRRSPPVSPDQVRAALAALEADSTVDTSAGIERRALQEALGQSAARLKKPLEAIVSDGDWVVVKQRPLTYGRPPQP